MTDDDYHRPPIRKPAGDVDRSPPLFCRTVLDNGRVSVDVPYPTTTSSSASDRKFTVTMPAMPWECA